MASATRFAILRTMSFALTAPVCLLMLPLLAAPDPVREVEVRAARLAAEQAALQAVRTPDATKEETALTDAIIAGAADAFGFPPSAGDFPSLNRHRHAIAHHKEEFVFHPDPLVRSLAQEAGHTGWQWALDEAPSMTDAVLQLRERGMEVPRLAYLMAVAYYVDRSEHRERAAEARTLAVELIAEAIRAPYPDRLAKRRAGMIMKEAVFILTSPMIDSLLEQLDADPPEDQWVMGVVLGELESRRAWNARGNRWASQTTPQQFASLERHLSKAREYFLAAHAADPACPEAATGMIGVVRGGLGEPGETEKLWFIKAYEAQPDFEPAYVAMRISLLPRWGGSTERLRDFTLWCAQPDRSPASVGLQAFLGLRSLESEVGARIWSDDELVSAVRSAIERLQLNNDSIAHPSYLRSCLLEIDAQTGRIREAARHLRAIGGEVSAHRLRTWDRPHRPYGPELLPFDSAGRARAEIADRAEKLGDWASAARDWTVALSEIDELEDPLAHQAVRTRLVRAQRTAALATGEWVDLDFQVGMTGLVLVAGEAEIVDESTIGLDRTSRDIPGLATVLFDLELTDNYEIEFDRPTGHAHVIVGWSEYQTRNDRYNTISWFGRSVRVGSSYDTRTVNISAPEGTGETQRVRVRVMDGELSVFIGDELRHTGNAPTNYLQSGIRVGVGQEPGSISRTDRSRFLSRVANIRVRSLNKE